MSSTKAPSAASVQPRPKKGSGREATSQEDRANRFEGQARVIWTNEGCARRSRCKKRDHPAADLGEGVGVCLKGGRKVPEGHECTKVRGPGVGSSLNELANAKRENEKRQPQPEAGELAPGTPG